MINIIVIITTVTISETFILNPENPDVIFGLGVWDLLLNVGLAPTLYWPENVLHLQHMFCLSCFVLFCKQGTSM